MTYRLIAEAIRKSIGVTRLESQRAASDLMKVMAKTLKKDGTLVLTGFGTLKVRRNKAREGRDPRTGEAIKIKARKTVRFKPSATLKRYI